MWLVRNIIFYFVCFVIFILSSANYLNHFETPFSREVYAIAAGLIFLVMLFKLRNKWTGILTLNKNAAKYNLIYTAPLSRKFLNYTILFNGAEIFICLFFGSLFLYFDKLSWLFSIVLLVNGVEGLFYLVYALRNGKFKVGMNENALVHNARGTFVVPFHDLKSIEYKYDEFFFIYTTGDALAVPSYVVEKNYMDEFKENVVRMAIQKGIFYSDKLR